MPGVLIVEARRGRGGGADRGGEPREDRIFAGIDDCRQADRRVGDTLSLVCEIDAVRGPIGRGRATAHVGDELAARGTLTFA
jgi:3-hydroxyacyl-[acyl-carrier-protein] dehydratase